MYKIQVTIENPMLGASRVLVYQFDPATLNQAKWNDGYTTVKAVIDDLLASEATTRSDFVPLSL